MLTIQIVSQSLYCLLVKTWLAWKMEWKRKWMKSKWCICIVLCCRHDESWLRLWCTQRGQQGEWHTHFFHCGTLFFISTLFFYFLCYVCINGYLIVMIIMGCVFDLILFQRWDKKKRELRLPRPAVDGIPCACPCDLCQLKQTVCISGTVPIIPCRKVHAQPKPHSSLAPLTLHCPPPFFARRVP